MVQNPVSPVANPEAGPAVATPQDALHTTLRQTRFLTWNMGLPLFAMPTFIPLATIKYLLCARP